MVLLNCGIRKALDSPLDCKEIEPVNPKGINPEYLLYYTIFIIWASLVAQMVRNMPAIWETQV